MELFGIHKIFVWRSLFKMCRSQFWWGFFLKLIYDALWFTNPILLHLVLIHIQKIEKVSWHGTFFAFSFLVLGLLQTLVYNQYFFTMRVMGLRIRSTLLSAIYRKCLFLSGLARLANPNNQIINLMENDIQILYELVPYLHIIWSGPLCITLSMLYLWYILGPSALIAFGVMVVYVPFNLMLTNQKYLLKATENTYKQEKKKVLEEYLNGIQVIKLNEWDNFFLNRITRIRKKEEKVFKNEAFIRTAIFTMFTLMSLAAVLFSFLSFLLLDQNNVLTPEVVFISLELFSNIVFLAGILPLVVMWLIEARFSIIQINRLLLSEELENVTHDRIYGSPVSIESGTFAWIRNVPALQDIKVTFEENKLTAIVGERKSGKSSLLAAILGDMRVLSGFVNTVGSVAYVPQNDWVQDTNLQDNITFGKPFEQEWYNHVIEKCDLKNYFETLADGDQTQISSIWLNIEQKQKLSLARAVYSQAEIYLLDSPLSAVSCDVRYRIFNEIMGRNGTLKNTTRILATQNLELISDADKVVVLKDGMILESGTLDYLVECNELFSHFLRDYVDRHFEKPEFEKLALIVGKRFKPKESTSKIENASSFNTITSIKDNKKLDFNVNRFDKSPLKYSTWCFYFKMVSVFSILIVILSHIIYEVLAVLTGLWLAKWSVDKHYINNNKDTYMEVYVFLALGQVMLVFVSTSVVYRACRNGAHKIYSSAIQKLFQAKLESMEAPNRVSEEFLKDIEHVDYSLPIAVKHWLTTFMMSFAILFVSSYLTKLFIWVVIPILLLLYMLQKFYIATYMQLNRMEAITKNRVYAYFEDSLKGASVFRAYDKTQSALTLFERKVDSNQDCRFVIISMDRWLSIRLEIMAKLLLFFCVWFSVMRESPHAAGYVGLAAYLLLKTTQTLNDLVTTTYEIRKEMKSVQRLKAYDTLPQEENDVSDTTFSPEWPSRGTIVFKTLFIMGPETYILKNLNAVISGGQKIGVVGKPGSGKTHLALTLFKLTPIYGGAVIIDDIDIATLPLITLRSRLTIVPQISLLISGTIQVNLDPYNNYEESEIWLALERAHLKEYVQALPFGLKQTIIGSGEELPLKVRQQICLARGLIRKSKILIMDEATSALNLKIATIIHKRITADFEDTTIITITNRLHTIMESDQIFVMDDGAIVECDSPKSLLSNNTSLFYGMCKEDNIV